MQNLSSLPGMKDPNALACRLMQRAHNQDGLPEIAIGITWLLISGLISAQVALPHGSIGFKVAVLALVILMPTLGFSTPAVLRWVRRRYFIERVGYVRHKPVGRKQIGFGILVAVLVSVALFGVVTRLARPDAWLLAGTGLFGGALMALGGRLPRFIIGGALMAAMGVYLACSGVALDLGFAILFGFEGVASLISGTVVCLRFMRQTLETGE